MICGNTRGSLLVPEPVTIHETIVTEVASWPGVTTAPHRFGGVELLLGRREIGHLHGDRLADLPFPRRVRDELVEAGCAEPHDVLPESGWVSFRIAGEADVPRVLELFRLGYERAATQRERAAAEQAL